MLRSVTRESSFVAVISLCLARRVIWSWRWCGVNFAFAFVILHNVAQDVKGVFVFRSFQPISMRQREILATSTSGQEIRQNKKMEGRSLQSMDKEQQLIVC